MRAQGTQARGDRVIAGFLEIPQQLLDRAQLVPQLCHDLVGTDPIDPREQDPHLLCHVQHLLRVRLLGTFGHDVFQPLLHLLRQSPAVRVWEAGHATGHVMHHFLNAPGCVQISH